MENITLNQIAYGILESVRSHISDDEDISIDYIKNLIHSTRSRLLKQRFDKNLRVIEDVFTQSLGAVEIEAVDASAHSTIKAGRYMYRTIEEIPATISRHNSEGTFTRIGPADQLGVSYNLVTYNRALFSGNGRYNKDVIFCFLKDNRIYIISNSGAYHKGVQFISVTGVFDNPTQVARFTDVAGNSLYSDTGRYPVSRTMADDIENLIIKEKFGIKLSAPGDKVNDGTNILQ